MDAGQAAPAARAGFLRRLAAPRPDKEMERPPQLAFGPAEAPPPAQAVALAIQQVAIQSIYLILPGLVAAQYGLVGLDIVRFIALSVAAVGVTGLLQVMTRGPFGSGYAVPSIPSPVFVAVYLLATPGASPVVAGTLAVAVGLVGMALPVLLRRLQAIVPTEVAGVVVFLIGVSLLPRAFHAAIGDPAVGGTQRLVAVGTLGCMIAVALRGGRLARYAVLAGAAAGTGAALLLGAGLRADTGLLGTAPWFALPVPDFASPAAFDAALLPAFGIALLASFASWTGDLVAFQRAADGGWRRPDTPPIRRGLLAQSLGMVLAGGTGGMVPATSSACVGLAIATRTLSRRVAVLGSLALIALACCPKALALVVLLPAPVEAAMLGYVCCFMLAAGCQLMTSRMLDARRTFTVGLGLALGIGVLLGLPIFAHGLGRALGSPVTAGAAVAILLNLLTAPLVAQRTAFVLGLGRDLQRELDDRMEALGGAWGARRETVHRLGHALLELAELLAARGVAELRVQARHDEDEVVVQVAWQGAPLPEASPRPDVADLDGPAAAREAFALWLATRHARAVTQRRVPGGWEIRLAFAD
jgi:NCS2 family nucleobase:cation symporter-2